MRKAIYKAVADRLKNQKVGVKFVSLWNRNTEQLSKQKAFRLPAVFVEFEPIEWSQLSRGARSADIRVRLHVVTETLASPEEGGKYQDRALEHLDLIERIGAEVQGLSGEGFNCFMLVESVTDHDHERVQHDEECFVTHATDTSAVKPRQPFTVPGLASLFVGDFVVAFLQFFVQSFVCFTKPGKQIGKVAETAHRIASHGITDILLVGVGNYFALLLIHPVFVFGYFRDTRHRSG